MLHSSELNPKFLLVDPRGSSVLEVGGFSEASSDSTGRPLEPALPALAHSPLSGVSLPFPPPAPELLGGVQPVGQGPAALDCLQRLALLPRGRLPPGGPQLGQGRLALPPAAGGREGAAHGLHQAEHGAEERQHAAQHVHSHQLRAGLLRHQLLGQGNQLLDRLHLGCGALGVGGDLREQRIGAGGPSASGGRLQLPALSGGGLQGVGGAPGTPRPAALLRAALTYRGAVRAGAAVAVCVGPAPLRSASRLPPSLGMGTQRPGAAYICFSEPRLLGSRDTGQREEGEEGERRGRDLGVGATSCARRPGSC